jgi:hypothetical protein
MKKTIFTSFIAILLFGVPAYAQTGGSLTASATKDTPVVKSAPDTSAVQSDVAKSKTEPLSIRKQKIETDLRATILKLQTVVDRTQIVIDLLNKNGKDTLAASDYLIKAKNSLKEATDALDQFSGVVIPETKIEAKAKTDEKISTTALVKEAPAPISLKDPLKKVEDALKDSKASIISSINALKDSLVPKDPQ